MTSPNNRVTSWALALILCSSVSCASAQPTDCQPTNAEAFDNCLEEYAQRLIAEEGYPSFSFSVVRGDSLVYARSFGVADRATGTAARPDVLYQVGSVTKSFVGLLFARLVEVDALRLGDPVALYLPEGSAVPTDSLGTVMTLQHLATHTAGLPHYPSNLDRDDGDPILGFSADELYEGLAQAELVHPIGYGYSYSNFGFGLLAHLMERATGSSLDNLLREHVLVTPGLDGVSLDLAAARQHLATPYRDDDPEVETRPWEMGTLSGAGGLFASAEALGAFASLLLRADNHADASELRDALRLMLTPFVRLSNNTRRGYGFGIHVWEDWNGHRVFWHGGDVDGYAAAVMVMPDSNVGVAFTTNSGMGRPLGALSSWLVGSVPTAFSK